MKKFIYTLLTVLSFTFFSCEGLVDGLNENPNEITVEDIDGTLFLTGVEIANISLQNGHLSRISGLWSGQLTGFSSLYSNIYGYSISTAESVGSWSRIYVGVVPNARYIQEVIPDDFLVVGISKVLEAHAVGTGASLFGDVPYSQINSDVEDPVFDSQVSVLDAMVLLLDDAIADLTAAADRTVSEDIHFQGSKDAWLEVAHTLKARYLLQLKRYADAYTAAQNGISNHANSMMYFPTGAASNSEGDKNLFWEILAGARTGDIGSGNSYMMQLLNPADANTRNHAKTDETARFGYLNVDETGANNNLGVIEQFEPMPMVTYAENQLILAETAARTSTFATALGHLNDFRAWLDGGGRLNANFSGDAYNYDAFDAADFAAGGIENGDNIDDTRALLREIIEERFISGFGTYMAFNDARRLRKSDTDISVPFPLNPGAATQHPERFPYSDDELRTNSNIDEDPGIYTVTEVNQ